MINMNRNKEYRLKRKSQRKDYIIQDKNLKLKTMYYQNKIKKDKIEQLQQKNKQLKGAIEEVWNFIKSYPGISQSGVMTIKAILNKVKGE